MCSPNSPKTIPWRNGEVRTFLRLLTEERIRNELDAVRNEQVFQEIVEAMGTHGYSRTSKQCREKLKKLKCDYRATKTHNSQSGAYHRNWKWFHEMDAIYGDKPASNGRKSGVDTAVPSPTPAFCFTSENAIAPEFSGTPEMSEMLAVAGPSMQIQAALPANGSMPQPQTGHAKRKRVTEMSSLSTALGRMADVDEKYLEKTTELNSLLAEEMRLAREQMQNDAEQRRVEQSQQDTFNNAFLEVLRGLVSAVADKQT